MFCGNQISNITNIYLEHTDNNIIRNFVHETISFSLMENYIFAKIFGFRRILIIIQSFNNSKLIKFVLS
jgi:hypothetical protein